MHFVNYLNRWKNKPSNKSNKQIYCTPRIVTRIFPLSLCKKTSIDRNRWKTRWICKFGKIKLSKISIKKTMIFIVSIFKVILDTHQFLVILALSYLNRLKNSSKKPIKKPWIFSWSKRRKTRISLIIHLTIWLQISFSTFICLIILKLRINPMKRPKPNQNGNLRIKSLNKKLKVLIKFGKKWCLKIIKKICMICRLARQSPSKLV